MAEEDGNAKKKRRRLKPEDKVDILRDLIIGGRKVSDIASEFGISPNQILNWRKEMFEGALVTFAQKRTDITEKAQRKRIEDLENAMSMKDSVIAEITQENLILKKKLIGRS